MNDLELVLVLLAVAAGLAVIAERLRVPYPILLVLGGQVDAPGRGLVGANTENPH
jgi:Kef-type K+ transport system membrane component KefB